MKLFLSTVVFLTLMLSCDKKKGSNPVVKRESFKEISFNDIVLIPKTDSNISIIFERNDLLRHVVVDGKDCFSQKYKKTNTLDAIKDKEIYIASKIEGSELKEFEKLSEVERSNCLKNMYRDDGVRESYDLKEFSDDYMSKVLKAHSTCEEKETHPCEMRYFRLNDDFILSIENNSNAFENVYINLISPSYPWLMSDDVRLLGYSIFDSIAVDETREKFIENILNKSVEEIFEFLKMKKVLYTPSLSIDQKNYEKKYLVDKKVNAMDKFEEIFLDETVELKNGAKLTYRKNGEIVIFKTYSNPERDISCQSIINATVTNVYQLDTRTRKLDLPKDTFTLELKKMSSSSFPNHSDLAFEARQECYSNLYYFGKFLYADEKTFFIEHSDDSYNLIIND